VTTTDLPAASTSNDTAVVEIKVEEGQATRQMDEFFRQTIAAIKEELTKKLETQNDYNKNDENLDGYETDTDFDDDSLIGMGSGIGECDRTYDMDNENETTMGDDAESQMSARQQQQQQQNSHHNYAYHLRNNRALLYQHIMTLLSSRRPTRRDRLNGWLVIIGCFLNQFIVDGLCYNYAALLEPVQSQFKLGSKLLAALPGTFLIGAFVLCGPLALFLTKQYGTRRVAIAGTLISSCSLLVSSFLTNIVTFTVLYGLCTGAGLALIYVPSLMTTSRWFLKRRLFANSLNVLGACAGAALYPLLTELLLQRFDNSLHDTLFILAALQLNCLVGSMLLRSNEQLKGGKSNLTAGEGRKRAAGGSNLTSPLIKHNQSLNTRPSRLGNNNVNNNRGRSQTGLGNNRYKRAADFETESTVSSTAVQSYTLKQHWRRFVQTRQTSANAKKNLFHLIAEEKKKTRTLSKQSLEDGFFITTSNNLLAPNDESHVVVTRSDVTGGKVNLAHGGGTGGGHHGASRSSRFFTRIANSIRSLAHPNAAATAAAAHASLASHANNSPASTTPHSKNQLAIHEISETTVSPAAGSGNSPLIAKNTSSLSVPSPLARYVLLKKIIMK
jgi:hypothetical protein